VGNVVGARGSKGLGETLVGEREGEEDRDAVGMSVGKRVGAVVLGATVGLRVATG